MSVTRISTTMLTKLFYTVSYRYAKEDFKKDSICIDHCVYHKGCEFPLSTVLINAVNGSRTIIHSNKNLPELTLEDFKLLDLSKYRWIHFEVVFLNC